MYAHSDFPCILGEILAHRLGGKGEEHSVDSITLVLVQVAGRLEAGYVRRLQVWIN